MNIAFIGYGHVGAPLADRLQRLGHTVTLAAADPESKSLKALRARNPALRTASPREAVRGAEVVFLATPYQANAAALQAVSGEWKGQVLVDCTNPVGPNLSHGLNNVRSGSEEVQQHAPGARIVKAFTIYGYENFEDSSFPSYREVKPAMLFCGQDADAKKIVGGLIASLARIIHEGA